MQTEASAISELLFSRFQFLVHWAVVLDFLERIDAACK
jgi:hypothetical protein